MKSIRYIGSDGKDKDLKLNEISNNTYYWCLKDKDHWCSGRLVTSFQGGINDRFLFCFKKGIISNLTLPSQCNTCFANILICGKIQTVEFRV